MGDFTKLGLGWLCPCHIQAKRVKDAVKLAPSQDPWSAAPDFWRLFPLWVHSFARPSWMSLCSFCCFLFFLKRFTSSSETFPILNSRVLWDKIGSLSPLQWIREGAISLTRDFGLGLSRGDCPSHMRVEMEESWHLAYCQLLLEIQIWIIYLQITMKRQTSLLRPYSEYRGDW